MAKMLPPLNNKKMNLPSTSRTPNTPTKTTLTPFIYYTISNSNILNKIVKKSG